VGMGPAWAGIATRPSLRREGETSVLVWRAARGGCVGGRTTATVGSCVLELSSCIFNVSTSIRTFPGDVCTIASDRMLGGPLLYLTKRHLNRCGRCC
jgi:hypothetical protein